MFDMSSDVSRSVDDYTRSVEIKDFNDASVMADGPPDQVFILEVDDGGELCGEGGVVAAADPEAVHQFRGRVGRLLEAGSSVKVLVGERAYHFQNTHAATIHGTPYSLVPTYSIVDEVCGIGFLGTSGNGLPVDAAKN